MHINSLEQCLSCTHNSINISCYYYLLFLTIVTCCGCLVAYPTVIPSSFFSTLETESAKYSSSQPCLQLGQDPVPQSWATGLEQKCARGFWERFSSLIKRQWDRDLGHYHRERWRLELWQPSCDHEGRGKDKSQHAENVRAERCKGQGPWWHLFKK